MQESFTLVLFGATGDLAKQMLYKSLFHLTTKELLSADFSLIGIGRTPHSSHSYVAYVDQVLQQALGERYSSEVAQRLLRKTSYVQGDIADDSLYTTLRVQLSEIQGQKDGPHNIVYKLSIKPDLYPIVVEKLGNAGLSHSTGWVRVLIEKPFGQNLRSSLELDQIFKQYFQENQIYRIDHYLSKETVQNMFAFRFGNGLLEPIWNRHFIDHIQISMLETLTVGNRGSFYEQTGALRDVIQNHLLQLLALTTMDVPESFTADSLQHKREAVFNSLKMMSADELAQFTVRGQYEGYQREPAVDPNSQTETYVALRAELETNRWAGVPIYIRAGKALAAKSTEVSIVFKQHVEPIFSNMEDFIPQANILTMKIAPSEGIAWRMLAKKPGPRLSLTPVSMQFAYSDLGEQLMEPYEKILLDAFKGEQMLFTSSREVQQQWKFVDPILYAWRNNQLDLLPYERGSMGPKEADLMMEREGKRWLQLG